MSQRPAPALRVAVVAATAAAAAALSVLPAATAAPATDATTSAPTTVTRDVAPAAFALPAAPAAGSGPAVTAVADAAAATSPAAVRTSAVSTALAQLGKPYSWGATGPGAFDCSGLVSYAFAQSGKDLPRTSRAQSTVGSPVSRANLAPGDLVFFYSPVSHVGIYIGGGQIVHASTSGQPVKISNVDAMPFNSARRV
ncbi:C40 family peptidase [Pseudonocardia nematodicida]|uniref:C40 family peptidase n=1 Tax=Pseudonocardia nematodicida TaxID=1206997 RepID=UPI0036215DF4